MKKYLPLYLILIVSIGHTVAQPVLNYSDINPVIGNTFNGNVSNYVAPGSAGANQTWDLTSMASTQAVLISAVTPASTGLASTYPSANLALTYPGSPTTFYNTNTSAFQFAGQSSAQADIVYSNLEDLLRFPATYNSSYTDAWHASFTSNGYPYSRTGSTTVTYDGYGTLKLPGGIYSNAVRVHFVQTYTDSSYIGGFWFVIPYNNDEYIWYLKGNHYPVATSFTLTASGSTIQSSTFLTNIVSGVNENSNALSFGLFPNPCADALNIVADATSGHKAEVKVYNSLGEVMETPELDNGIMNDNKFRLDTRKLSQGIYYARILVDGVESSSKQFIVAR